MKGFGVGRCCGEAMACAAVALTALSWRRSRCVGAAGGHVCGRWVEAQPAPASALSASPDAWAQSARTSTAAVPATVDGADG